MSTIRARRTILLITMLSVLIASGAAASDSADQEQPPGMTPEMMAAWEEASKPGPEHEMLAAMAGSWTFEGTFWMSPDAPPMTTTGTADRRMMLDGRVLIEKVRSEWQGESFEGIAMTGFDNVTGSYWSTWMDSMSTGYASSTGSCTDAGCEFEGSYNDPMTGKAKHNRTTLAFEDDREVHENFEQSPEGEFKSMVLVYTRVKK